MNDEIEYEIGPLSYRIKRVGKTYTLWLGGCRIGRPRADKPGGMWEYSAPTATAAAKEIETDASERLSAKITALRTQIIALETTHGDLRMSGCAKFRVS